MLFHALLCDPGEAPSTRASQEEGRGGRESPGQPRFAAGVAVVASPTDLKMFLGRTLHR